MAAKKRAAREVKVTVSKDAGLGKWNYAIIGAGVVAIAVGFALILTGETTVSTVLLVLGYMVVVPLGILLRFPKREGVDDTARKVG